MSDGFIFLTSAQIDRLHEISLKRYGGLTGIGNPGLIESALASAQNAFFYGRGDVFDVAAAYAFHIAEAQAFNDGNKRTAVAAALTFLELNAGSSTPSEDALYEAMIDIANKRLNKAGLAELMRSTAKLRKQN
jgi:death-on-curing protein